MADTVLDHPFTVPFTHRVRFTRDALRPDNLALRDALEAGTADSPRALAFLDSHLADAWPNLAHRLHAYFHAHPGLPPLVATHLLPGGETCKNQPELLQQVLRQMHDARLCRRSIALAIGGGAVLDLVGFAAAIAHRGVRLVRMPTTTLAQADSGVGVKSGVNAFGKKNFLGAFAVPWAVVNDEAFLATLADRDWRAGFAEAVKVALVKDAALFDAVEAAAPAIARGDMDAARPIVRRSAQLHLEHITAGGDPFELTRARPLDFGHWAAHKLEQMTGFSLRHGEAVAIGVALDTTYSHLAGHLSPLAARRVRALLRALGFELHHDAMRDVDALLQGLEEFREHLGGELTVTLLHAIGGGFDAHAIDRATLGAALATLAEDAADRPREERRDGPPHRRVVPPLPAAGDRRVLPGAPRQAS